VYSSIVNIIFTLAVNLAKGFPTCIFLEAETSGEYSAFPYVLYRRCRHG
jgi:hypothetical protein